MLAIANGAGPKRAFLAVAGPDLEMVCNIGFCGAVNPELQIADIVVGTSVNGEEIETPQSRLRHRRGAIASVDHVVRSKREKESFRSGGALAVEMEAAGALERARAAGVPFHCVRAVSDRATEDLRCDFNRALRDDGRFDIRRLALDAVLHPLTCLPELIRLGKRTELATERLGEFLASCEF
jgi:nucleoside phosphorylase